MTKYELAQTLAKSFYNKERTNGVKFKVTDNEQARDCAHAVHKAMPGQPLPDDWLYSMTYRALDTISELNDDVDPQEAASTFAEGETDVYYNELRQWFANCSIAPDMIDEATEELGPDPIGGIWGLITRGQAYTLERVFNVVYDYVETVSSNEVVEV